MTKLPMPPRRLAEAATRFAEIRKGGDVAAAKPTKPRSSSRPGGAGVLVGVRLQPDLVARLDEVRSGLTRPAFIRRMLVNMLTSPPSNRADT